HNATCCEIAESLDKVQSLVENKFQDIRNSNLFGFQSTGLPFTSEHRSVLVKAVPIKERHKLTVAWPTTPSWHHYKEGPCDYLGLVIGHKGEGSVYYILQKLGKFARLFKSKRKKKKKNGNSIFL
ncbi:Peptidase M16, partial [Theobroma cacao]